MKNEIIGKNAGIVWRTLRGNEREMSIEDLTQATGLDKTDVAAAIGWLAREGKIIFKETDEDCLMTVFKEYYY